MNEPDYRLLKQIQIADRERQQRIAAERVASALRAQNIRLQKRLRQLTGDAAPRRLRKVPLSA